MGYLAEGQLFLCGRKKDLIIVGGSNVHPEHLEAAARAALDGKAGRLIAFGVRDEEIGTEAPVLVCELPQRLPDNARDDLAQHVRQRVFEDLAISLGDVCFVDKGWIAKTTSGKLARAASRQQYLEQREDREAPRPEAPLDTSPAGSPEVLERQLQALFETQLSIRPIRPADNLFAVGGDSIQIMSALAEIEARTEREVPLEALMQEPTIEHLVKLLKQPRPSDPSFPSDPVSSSAASRSARPPNHVLSPKELARRVIVACLPYPVGAPLVARFFDQPLVQQLIFRDEVRALRQFYRLIEQPLVDEAAFIHQALTFRRGRFWRIAGSVRATPENMDRWVEVVGWPLLQRAYEQGRGVVLVHSHTFSLPFARHFLKRMLPTDRRAVVSIAAVQRGLLDVERDAFRRQRYVEQLYACQKALEQGGIASIAGDERQGTSRGVTLPFHGRQRLFKTGFAHLAVTTGAQVLPVFTSSTLSGKATIEFGEPFVLASADQAPDKQIEALVRVYATYLEEKWRVGAANIPPAKMRNHLALPSYAVPITQDAEHAEDL